MPSRLILKTLTRSRTVFPSSNNNSYICSQTRQHLVFSNMLFFFPTIILESLLYFDIAVYPLIKGKNKNTLSYSAFNFLHLSTLFFLPYYSKLRDYTPPPSIFPFHRTHPPSMAKPLTTRTPHNLTAEMHHPAKPNPIGIRRPQSLVEEQRPLSSSSFVFLFFLS